MDELVLGGISFSSRFIMGSGKFDPELISACVEDAKAQIVTLALRRVNKDKDSITEFIPKNVTLLPNTSGARNADEALRIARLSRELGCGNFIKVEVIRDSKYLFPDNYETIKATEKLANEGFIVLPYMYPDLTCARDLVNAGASAVMPLAAPIGSNKGLINRDIIQILIDEIDIPIIVDAGIGRPSEACAAMEMGCAAIMVNTAIATSKDIRAMAKAFCEAIIAGRTAYKAGLGRVKNIASASSPLTGFLGEN
ncbi:thiazole synthase [Campylobacter fetus]|uniref:thiazole synthase n=1 Tax=Campylobacter fetus TaxID=196 RepID=UPI000FCB2301|nr:thiazole synthase [Campylobacter fetus]RUT49430.1 thiazole synthase [Campylobacter fetus]RUT49689.1 thiazole synthase [Campylobacter fetus]